LLNVFCFWRVSDYRDGRLWRFAGKELLLFCLGFLLRYFGTQPSRGIVTLSMAKGFAGRGSQLI
jgi:hypothetical protein